VANGGLAVHPHSRIDGAWRLDGWYAGDGDALSPRGEAPAIPAGATRTRKAGPWHGHQTFSRPWGYLPLAHLPGILYSFVFRARWYDHHRGYAFPASICTGVLLVQALTFAVPKPPPSDAPVP
jgi:hypothetical protein